jgi:hypothetical protein
LLSIDYFKTWAMTIKKFLFMIFLTAGVFTAMGQTNPGEGGGNTGGSPGGGIDPGNGESPPPGGGVPVDGGIGLLLAAGVGYGAKKAYDYRKGQKSKGKS